MNSRFFSAGGREGIVAIGLLTDDDLRRLGPQFSRAFPVDDTPMFSGLLQAIDEAEQELLRREATGRS
jgi:hypothetical protein